MKKMDEMELCISLKSIKFAWFYTVLILFIWTIYTYIKHHTFYSIAFFLLISQNIIYHLANKYFKWTVR